MHNNILEDSCVKRFALFATNMSPLWGFCIFDLLPLCRTRGAFVLRFAATMPHLHFGTSICCYYAAPALWYFDLLLLCRTCRAFVSSICYQYAAPAGLWYFDLLPLCRTCRALVLRFVATMPHRRGFGTSIYPYAAPADFLIAASIR